jgi:hypothetical protein
MAIDKGNLNAMNNLGYYYENIEKNYDLAKKYYLMAIDKGNLASKDNIKQLTTILERYVLFKKNNIEFDEEINKDIHIFNNKIKNYSVKEECKLCYNVHECIPLSCFCHRTCIDCYVQIYNKPCPFCRL